MQHARDTFYVMLRDRLALLNPERTIVLRVLSRPGVLVAENETPSAHAMPDAFTLQWTSLRIEARGSLPLATMECEIRYLTDGTAALGGMDRGQSLGSMDAELTASLMSEPSHVTKMNYSSGTAVALKTEVFWGPPVFRAAVASGERLTRTATVDVWCLVEAGEM